MEKFDISKGVSGLFLPVDDNISQWTSLYNTRMHYRMLADQQRQQANRLKGDAMVKEIDQLLAFSANPMFDGSVDNKIINDTIGKYRDSIIDIKSRLLGGDMGALEEGANVLSQFSKDLDPNSNAIKSFGKQSYIVGKIDSMRKQLSDTNLFTLDAATQYNSKINDLINQYNTGKIDVDKLTQEINNIDNRNFRSLNKYSEAAKNISQEEWDSLSADGKWKYNTKSINQNKAMSLLLDSVNYVGGKDMDLFNFYKVTKNSKGEDVYELITDDEYNKIQEANKNATNDKQKVKTDTRLKTNIRECATIACRRVLGEVYPVMKGTSRTQSETEHGKAMIELDKYRGQKKIDEEDKIWQTQLQSLLDYRDATMKQLEDTKLSQEERKALIIELGKRDQAIQEFLNGKTATETVAIPNNNIGISREQFQSVVNGNGTTGNRTADIIAANQRKIGTLLVNINDKKGTVDAIYNNIKKYHEALFNILNAKGNAKQVIEILVSNGIEEANKKGIKGNDGNINATQLLKLADKANIHNIIGDDSLYDNSFETRALDAWVGAYGVHPALVHNNSGNNIGAILEQSNKDKLEQAYKEANELHSLNGTQNVKFATLHNPASISNVMNEMDTDGATFISTSTVPGDPIKTLQDKTVRSVLGYGISKLGEPVFKVIYNDKDGNIKSDIFVYKNVKKGNLINNLNATESITQKTIPKFVTDEDYTNAANFTTEQNRVLDEAHNGVKDFIKDYNQYKASHSKDYENDNKNQYYSYDVEYGNNTIKFTILKDANGNLTNRYTVSTVINGKNKEVKVYPGMSVKEINKAIYHNLLKGDDYNTVQQKTKR